MKVYELSDQNEKSQLKTNDQGVNGRRRLSRDIDVQCEILK